MKDLLFSPLFALILVVFTLIGWWYWKTHPIPGDATLPQTEPDRMVSDLREGESACVLVVKTHAGRPYTFNTANIKHCEDYPRVTKIHGELWMDKSESRKVYATSDHQDWIPIYSVRVRVREEPK